ncbi:MAG: nucleotidyltransferase domain-containing protein [Candidatus Obscuribacterales bacterium]|nr:nucleotidyltransferase domain-containing protein [Candidatus Obscuribacterales bacterium]
MDSGLDAGGFIRSIGAVELQSDFEALVKAALGKVLDSHRGNELHSIYLYGSVATASAKRRTSDLDMLVVFREKPSVEAKERISSIEEEIGHAYSFLVRDAGIAVASLEDIFAAGNQVGWGCFIKHMCRSLHGDDIGALFPAFRPTKTVVYGLNDDLFQQMEKFTDIVRGSTSAAGVIELAKLTSRETMVLARKLIRASFGLVVEECGFWSTDLRLCAETFCKHYPERCDQMQQTLLIAQGSVDSMSGAVATLNSFGPWLCREFENRVAPFRSQELLVVDFPLFQEFEVRHNAG